MAKKRNIRAEDLYSMQIISACAISPDGKNVITAVQRVDKKTEKKYSNLWIIPVSGGKPEQFTYGDFSDCSPKWSPDGSCIAFISNRGDEKQPQIYTIPVNGGEARPLTSLQGVISGFEWSPDSKKMVCVFRKKDKDVIEREADEAKKKLGVVCRHYTRVFFKTDGGSYLPHERNHLLVIDMKTGKTKELTKGQYEETEPAWSPDSKSLVFLSNRSKDPDMFPHDIDVFVIPVSGGKELKLKTRKGDKSNPFFSPDGKTIAYIGTENSHEWWRKSEIWLADASGKKEVQSITEKTSLEIQSWTISDSVAGPGLVTPVFSPDGKSILFQAALHGNTTLHSINIKTGKVTDVITDDGVLSWFSVDKKGENIAYVHASWKDPGQIFVKTPKETVKLTTFNKWLNSVELGSVEEIWFKGSCKNDLQGWIIKPPSFSAQKKYPSIMQIHGGPLVQYGKIFMFEFYFLAAAGYVVYFTNPRGGRGYGEEHAKAIWRNWGSVDYEDLMKWADYMEKKPYIDKKLMGVTGGSYGGYMTNWIIGHTDRFKAAVTQRCVVNLISMWGTSDVNWHFQEENAGKPPWELMEDYWRQSPLKYIGNAKTPTLVIHSEQDHRCAIEQGEQVFVALKVLGVDTEFVIFPEESHGLSRGGRTDRRIARLNHIERWFKKYLKK